jgi:hypothetical protein
LFELVEEALGEVIRRRWCGFVHWNRRLRRIMLGMLAMA